MNRKRAVATGSNTKYRQQIVFVAEDIKQATIINEFNDYCQI